MPDLHTYLTVARTVGRGLVNPRVWRRKLSDALWRRSYARPAVTPPEFLGNLLGADPIPGGLELRCVGGVLRVEFLAAGIARVRLSRSGVFPAVHSYAVLDPDRRIDITVNAAGPVWAAAAGLRVTVSPSPCRLTFSDDLGRVLWADAEGAGWLGEGVTAALRLPQEMALYGLGEKAFGLNHRGRRLRMWNTDPKGGYHPLTDPLYISIPFLVGQGGGVASGLLFDNTYAATFDLGHGQRDRVVYTAAGGELCYYVLAGPTLADVLTRYADLVGHMSLPPLWALGYHQSRWSYQNAADLRRVAAELRSHRIPCDALYLDIDYMDGYRVFTWDRERFPDPAGLLADLAGQGYHVVTIIDPGVKADPAYAVCAEGLARDAFCRLPDGELYTGPVWPGECYFPDFSAAEVREWWGNLYGPLLEAGVAGFWNDMNEPAVFPATTFPDAVQHRADAGPTDHRALHNVYGQLMAQACAEGVRRLRPDERPFVISRSGYAGIGRYALNWTGDNESSWAHLRLSIPMVLNLGLSGQPFAGPDVGGFNAACDGELLARWTQLGAFLPFFRNHSAVGTPDQEPYAFGEPYTTICRRYIELRYRLLPYLYTAFWQAATAGLPVARPLALAFGADRRTASLDDEYLFGDAFLVAPILAPAAHGRGVYLPAGVWYDFWTGECYHGPADVPAHAPLETLPLYVRGGSVIPMGPVVQHTGQLTPGPLELHIFPGEGESLLYEDDGRSQGYQRGEFRLTRFVLHRDGDSLALERRVEGAFAGGSQGFDLVWHGGNTVSLRVDGQPIGQTGPGQKTPVRVGLFDCVEIAGVTAHAAA